MKKRRNRGNRQGATRRVTEIDIQRYRRKILRKNEKREITLQWMDRRKGAAFSCIRVRPRFCVALVAAAAHSLGRGIGIDIGNLLNPCTHFRNY